ncbi:uncharacterized protein G2W53_037191 [Senna tora]|uniref:SWIM-type domain-containing protein n=1 Tax=Senna tora TaxID=362788 RepID=A0A834SVT6_9FABA|nr:uncharacterized protein G2W53_037191 [Senna tora]
MRIYAKSITSWPQSVGPRIVKAINETIEDARFCRVKLAGRNLYEVYDGFTRFPVDLVSHTCECKAWQISGLPCKHGAAAIIYTRAKVENFCDAYYSIEKYITTYSGLGASTSASQTSIRREIQEYASVQAKAKSQLKAKRTKRLPFHASPSLLLLPSWFISFIGGNIQFSPFLHQIGGLLQFSATAINSSQPQSFFATATGTSYRLFRRRRRGLPMSMLVGIRRELVLSTFEPIKTIALQVLSGYVAGHV